MKRVDWILAIMIISSWFIEEIYHIAPRNTKITPFVFSEETLSFRWYVFEISNYIRIIIFALCYILSAKKIMHWIVKDLMIITLIMIVFSLFWFLFFYNNPFYNNELWIKILITILIYIEDR